jgi:hypothetical protein
LEPAFVELVQAGNLAQSPALCSRYVEHLLGRGYSLCEIEAGLARTYTLIEMPFQYTTLDPDEKRLKVQSRPLVQLVAVTTAEYPNAEQVTDVLRKTGKRYLAVVACARDPALLLSVYKTGAKTAESNMFRLQYAHFLAHSAGSELPALRAGIKELHRRDLAQSVAERVKESGSFVRVLDLDLALRAKDALRDPEMGEDDDNAYNIQCAMSWMEEPYAPLWHCAPRQERPESDQSTWRREVGSR